MTGLTFHLNDIDLSNRISTFSAQKIPTASQVLTSLGGTEYAFYGTTATEIAVSFFPMTEQETTDVYHALLTGKCDVTYTDPYQNGKVTTRRFRLTNSLDAAFRLLSVDGKRRYSGAVLQLRTSQ